MKRILLILAAIVVSITLSANQNKTQPNKLDNLLKQLSLTEQQQQAIDQIQEKYQEQNEPVAKILASPTKGQSKEAIQQQMKQQMQQYRKIQQQKMKKIRAVLTEEQKIKLRQLRGAKKVEKNKE